MNRHASVVEASLGSLDCCFNSSAPACNVFDGLLRACAGGGRGKIPTRWAGNLGGDGLATRRVTLREAAAILGLSKEAVRKRVIRGTLDSDTGADGRRYVYLDAGGDEPPTHEGDALISEMRSRIQFLEDELQRKDAILLNMTEAMKALSPPSQETPSEAQESDVSPGPADTPTEATSGAQEGAQRPWWRRIFRG